MCIRDSPYTAGLTPPTGGVTVDFTVPDTPGEYYIGMIIDTENTASELNEENNTTLPAQTAFFVIEDDTTPAGGAIKIVNSWGTGGWENKNDGHYWLTYDTIKSLQLSITYYQNDFDTVYQPRVLAVFNLTHPLRELSLIHI